MSLIHWWPLNGNLNDYGINNIVPTQHGTVTYLTAGKIGRTCKTSTSFYFDTAITATNQMSFAFWVYPDSAGAWTDMFSIGTNLGRIELTSNSTYVYYWYQTNNGGANLCDSGEIFTLSNQRWYHIIMTADGTNVRFYVDGELKKTKPQSNPVTSAMNDNLITWARRGVSSTSIYSGCFNDIRIYNHVLTIAEIRELSKGLILHYNFEDVESNLLSGNYGTSTYTTIDNTTHPFPGMGTIYKISASGKTSNIYTGLSENISSRTSAGDTVTLSFWIYCENKDGVDQGTELRIYRTYSDGTSTSWGPTVNWKSTYVNNTWMHYSLTYTFEANCTGRIFNMNLIRNGTIWLAGMKVEFGNVATPFTGYRSSGAYVYDNSGYGYNGTISGNLQITADSTAGQHAAVFGSNIYIEPPRLPDFCQVTYSFWVKLNGNSQAYRAVFIPKNNPTGGIWLSLNTEGYGLWAYQGGNSPNYCKYGSHLSDNTWYLCTHVFNNGVGQWYLNGQPITGTTTYTTRPYITGGVYTIGDSYTGSSWSGTPFDGEISDFKIYATALSAADILTEYQRKAAIYQDGTLITGNFVEQKTAVELPLTSTYFTLGDGSSFNTANRLMIVNGRFVGFQFANSLFTFNKCYHLSFDAQYQSGTFLNILGHSNNFAVNAYLDGKKLTTAWGSVPSGAVAEENVMLDGKWHHFDLYIKYQSQNDSYGQWVQVNRTSGSGSALVWFTNLMMEEIATMTTMPTVQMPTKTEMIQSAGFEEYADHVYVSHTGLIGSSHIVEK